MLKHPLTIVLISLALCACSTQAPPIPDIADWQAEWIGAPWEGESFVPEADHPAPEFAKTMTFDSRPRSAIMYICGLGMFEAAINGKRVGEDYYVPNETMYGIREPGYTYGIKVDESTFKNFRVMYLAYDVTDLLKKGRTTSASPLETAGTRHTGADGYPPSAPPGSCARWKSP